MNLQSPFLFYMNESLKGAVIMHPVIEYASIMAMIRSTMSTGLRRTLINVMYQAVPLKIDENHESNQV